MTPPEVRMCGGSLHGVSESRLSQGNNRHAAEGLRFFMSKRFCAACNRRYIFAARDAALCSQAHQLLVGLAAQSGMSSGQAEEMARMLGLGK